MRTLILIFVFATFLFKCTAYKASNVVEGKEAILFRKIAYNSLNEARKNLCADNWMFTALVKITSYRGKSAVEVIMPNDDGIHGPDVVYINFLTLKIMGKGCHL